MRTWIHAIGVAALVSGAAQAQTISEKDARSYLLSAFITGAAPAILGENVQLAPELRERLGLAPQAGRGAIYDALIALTDGKPLKVSGSLKQVPAGARQGLDRPLLELDAGDVRLVMQYDLQANNVSYVGLPGSAAVTGASTGEETGAVKVAMTRTPAARPAVVLPPVLFAFDRARLSDEAATVLDAALAEKLARASAIRITGHADPLGPADYNQRLSEKRAQAVRERLVTLGIDASRIEISGAGAASGDECAAARSRKERIACLAPERRVDVAVELPPR